METPPDLAAEPLVGSVTHVATTVLRPDAERTAVEGVSRAWLDEPATGVKQATAGFAYLRHPRPPVSAERCEQGWRLRGRVLWMTGWGLADTAVIGAVTADDRALFVRADCTPGPGAGPGMAAVESPPLWAMGATHTAAVELRGRHRLHGGDRRSRRAVREHGRPAGPREALFHLIQAQTPQLREATAAVTLRGF
ncbi:hypothetical protein [Streptomyces nojiriensis]|uniref:hypothetical protein n=1 Tax=Streptomyces nojiriensis TaxID=66374 RepID=UPI0036567EDB